MKKRVEVKEAVMLKTTKVMLAALDPEAVPEVAVSLGAEAGVYHAAGVDPAVKVEAAPDLAVVAEAEVEAGLDLAARARADLAAEEEAAAEVEAVAARKAVKREVTARARLRKRRKRRKSVLFLVQTPAAQTANEIVTWLQGLEFCETVVSRTRAHGQARTSGSVF